VSRFFPRFFPTSPEPPRHDQLSPALVVRHRVPVHRMRKFSCKGQICRLIQTVSHKQSHYLPQTVLVRIVVVRRVPGLYAHLLALTHSYNDPPQNDKSRCVFRVGTNFMPPPLTIRNPLRLCVLVASPPLHSGF
jgi:hypothetical protein